MTDNTNPGNFANRPKEEVQNIASKGGQTGTENSGFASMPKEQVVSLPLLLPLLDISLISAAVRDRQQGWPGQLRLFRKGQRGCA